MDERTDKVDKKKIGTVTTKFMSEIARVSICENILQQNLFIYMIFYQEFSPNFVI